MSLIALSHKTVAHTFLPSFDNGNGRLCQERVLRSRNFATTVTLRQASLYNSSNVLAFSHCFALPIKSVLNKSSAWACFKWSKLLITGRRMYRIPQGYLAHIPTTEDTSQCQDDC